MDMKTIIIIFVCATFSLIKPSLAYNDNSTFKNVEQKNTKSINVHSAWSRALPPITPNGAVYLTIDNNSNINDRILAAHSPVAKQVTLHKSIHHGDHLMMEQQHFIDVKANQSFYFEHMPVWPLYLIFDEYPSKVQNLKSPLDFYSDWHHQILRCELLEESDPPQKWCDKSHRHAFQCLEVH